MADVGTARPRWLVGERVEAMLERHCLINARWVEMAHNGFSGADIYCTQTGHKPGWVAKRVCHDLDWVMQSTEDHPSREASIAKAMEVTSLPLSTPYVGAVDLGDEAVVLMHDISDDLLGSSILSEVQTIQVVEAIAGLHIHGSDRAALPTSLSCDVAHRLGLLRPAQIPLLRRSGRAALAELLESGWRRFFQIAPPDLGRMVRTLHNDPTALVHGLAVDGNPTMLHGDLKLDNIAIDRHGSVAFFDWALWTHSSPALELGWFLAVNADRLAMGPGDVLRCYLESSPLAGAEDDRLGPLTALCGLVLRGWSDVLLAEVTPSSGSWWTTNGQQALDLLRSEP